jgi:arsenate reductase
MSSAFLATQVEAKFQPQVKAGARVRIAFVCIGNACRSQMAEGWVRHRAVEGIEAVSAGLAPLGYITPETAQVMKEKNVSVDGQQSKGLEAIDWKQVDVLVNMTFMPVRSVVPGFSGRRVEWRVPDPFQGSMRTYRRVRDLLERRVNKLIAELKQDSGGGSTAPPEPGSKN